jgi:hypothetical protein
VLCCKASLGYMARPYLKKKETKQKKYFWPGLVAHVSNPSYLGCRDQEDQFEASLSKKLARPPSHQICQTRWFIPLIQAAQEAQIGGL